MRTIGLLALALTPAGFASTAAFASPGALDPEFGGDGIVINPGRGSYRAVAIAPDGKIVAAAYTGGAAAVWRLHRDGSPDESFGAGGVAKISPTSPQGIAVRPDGKIIVVGSTGDDRGFVVRLRADGGPGVAVDDGLDTAFDVDGKVFLDDNAHAAANAVALQPDARIVVAGYTVVEKRARVIVWRLKADGGDHLTAGAAFDSTFDFDGRAELQSQTNDVATAVALQPDGKLVAAGLTVDAANQVDAVVWRLLPDGGAVNSVNSAIDRSFDVDGAAGMNHGRVDAASAVAVLPGGQIVAAGYTTAGIDGTQDAVVWRLMPNGGTANRPNDALDNTFDVDGFAGMHAGGEEQAHALAVQPDGQIVVAGRAAPPDYMGNENLAVWRVRPDGGTANVANDALDPGFGTGGLTRVAAGDDTVGNDMALQADGRIVVAGKVVSGPTGEPALFRLLGDPPPTATDPPTAASPTEPGDGPPVTGDLRPPDATTPPRVGLRLLTRRIRRGRVRVRASNPGRPPVTGRLSAGRAARARSFRVAPNAATVVTLRLSRPARRTLERTGRLRLRLHARISNGTQSATVSRTVTVRPAKRGRRG